MFLDLDRDCSGKVHGDYWLQKIDNSQDLEN